MKKVDLCFPVASGYDLNADHGYTLFSAVRTIVPSIHGNKEVALQQINGLLIRSSRKLKLQSNSKLRLRLPPSLIPEFSNLSGKTILVGKTPIRVGPPQICILTPVHSLYSRMVTFSKAYDVDSVQDLAATLLDSWGINSYDLSVPQVNGEPVRRTIKVHNASVSGWAMQVYIKDPDESTFVQENFMGGRNRFGCGIFIPNLR